MKIEDLDKSLHEERKQTKKAKDIENVNIIYGLGAVIGLVFTILFYSVFPGSILLGILTAITWSTSGVAKIMYDPRSLIWIFSFINALLPILSLII